MRCPLSAHPLPVGTAVAEQGSRQPQKDAGKVDEMSSPIESDPRTSLTRRGELKALVPCGVLSVNIFKNLRVFKRHYLI